MSRLTLKFKWIPAIAAIMVLTLVAPALASTPCASVALSLSPSTVARGSKVTVAASITNCSDAAESVTVKFTIDSPLGAVSLAYPLDLAAGQTQTATFTYKVPRWTPPGVYNVTVAVFSDTNVLLSSASATLTVT